MTQTIECTETCPYCGQSFYLSSDCAEHVKTAHLDFGRRSAIFARGQSWVEIPDEADSSANVPSRATHARCRR
jgi:hypothetical protein